MDSEDEFDVRRNDDSSRYKNEAVEEIKNYLRANNEAKKGINEKRYQYTRKYKDDHDKYSKERASLLEKIQTDTAGRRGNRILQHMIDELDTKETHRIEDAKKMANVISTEYHSIDKRYDSQLGHKLHTLTKQMDYSEKPSKIIESERNYVKIVKELNEKIEEMRQNDTNLMRLKKEIKDLEVEQINLREASSIILAENTLHPDRAKQGFSQLKEEMKELKINLHEKREQLSTMDNRASQRQKACLQTITNKHKRELCEIWTEKFTSKDRGAGQAHISLLPTPIFEKITEYAVGQSKRTGDNDDANSPNELRSKFEHNLYNLTEELPKSEKPKGLRKEEKKYQKEVVSAMRQHQQTQDDTFNKLLREKSRLDQELDEARDKRYNTIDPDSYAQLKDEIGALEKLSRENTISLAKHKSRAEKRGKKLLSKMREEHIKNTAMAWLKEYNSEGYSRWREPVIELMESESVSRKDIDVVRRDDGNNKRKLSITTMEYTSTMKQRRRETDTVAKHVPASSHSGMPIMEKKGKDRDIDDLISKMAKAKPQERRRDKEVLIAINKKQNELRTKQMFAAERKKQIDSKKKQLDLVKQQQQNWKKAEAEKASESRKNAEKQQQFMERKQREKAAEKETRQMQLGYAQEKKKSEPTLAKDTAAPTAPRASREPRPPAETESRRMHIEKKTSDLRSNWGEVVQEYKGKYT